MKKQGKRSPFPNRSLPQAGESLGDEAYDLFFDRFFKYAAAALASIIFAAMLWVSEWLGNPIRPRHMFFWGVLFGVLALWRWFKIKPQLEQIWLGRRGEREVGRALERLRRHGYDVFHDVPGKGFNVDHVLIGPGGVFAIETKTVSKPNDHDAQIDFDGETVRVDGFIPDRDPVKQARASASHVAEIIQRTTGHVVPVRPVVIYPGWYINGPSHRTDVWVLNAKAFLKWVGNEPIQMRSEDVALYVDRMTGHLQACE